MKLIRDPLRLVEAAVQAATVLTAVLAPYRSFALAPERVAVSAGVLAALTVVVYALHAVTFDHFRLTGHSRSRTATAAFQGAAETPGTGIVAAATTRRAQLR
jgi:hypothetical protein